ncbi:ankyrin repeat protein [Luteitalea pratensis]|uniref:Ankyrin repeat protein n=2 Tax=Luteitalea pratensis TaxID=1855912 RepID=A0A143PHE0_LUTPR|nr:ankyrin repeat protein [Luteitalea pratensis]
MKSRLLALSALLALALLPGVQDHADVLIRHVTVVDVEHGLPIADQAVATSGSRIVATGGDATVASAWRATQTIDASGQYLIPGLWDMHMHFGGGADLIEENKALLPLYVAHGITTVRDASGDLPQQVLAWRREIADGTLFGPTLLSSGPKIEGIAPVWKGTLETGSEADIDKAMITLRGLDVDFVKITDSTLKPELFPYAVRKARAAGLKASGHIPMALTVREAVDAGISSIEHLDYAFKAGVKDEAAIAADFAAGRIDRAEANRRLDAGFDRATAMKAYRYLAEKTVSVSPTLNGSRIIAFLDQDSHQRDAYLAYIGPGLRKTYEGRVQRAAQADEAAIAQRHAHYGRVAAVLPLLQQAGVTILAGTDAGFLNSFNYPGAGLHDELALYVQNGLTPAQALSSATRSGPAWFGRLDTYGAISVGRAADMVLLDRNPLDDITATRTIRAVMLRGTVHDRAALDRMLADTRDKVAAWNGAGSNMNTMTLHAAAASNDVAAIRNLLATGAAIDARDERGRTALLVATHANTVGAARALIEAGADVNAKDDIHDSAYLYAGASGHLEILKMTLEHGADLKSTNRYGGTALIPAAERGHVDTVRTLIDAGVDVDHVNNLGWTALLEAVILGDGGVSHARIVQLLVKAGARVSLADRDGVTPLGHARSRGFRTIENELVAAGAQ